MPINRVQFQPGLSLPAFLEQFGTEAKCEQALEQARWPEGFRCPECGHTKAYVLQGGTHKCFQCLGCRKQTSLIAGTLFQSTHLALTVWFLAIYLISQAKTGLSALALKRQIGVSYPTAWLIQHKLMQAMSERDSAYTLEGEIQVDDAYLGGEFTGGKAGRGSENKVPFVAAVSLTAEGHPKYVKMAPVPGFTLKAIANWAANDLAPGFRAALFKVAFVVCCKEFVHSPVPPACRHFRTSRAMFAPLNSAPLAVRRPCSFQRRAIASQFRPLAFRLSASRHSAALPLSRNGSGLSDTGLLNKSGCGPCCGLSFMARSRNVLTVVPSQGSPPKLSRVSTCSGDSQIVMRLNPSSLRRSRSRCCRARFVSAFSGFLMVFLPRSAAVLGERA